MSKKVLLITTISNLVLGAPFENLLRKVSNTYQGQINPAEQNLWKYRYLDQNINVSKRKSGAWPPPSYQDLTPGVDTDSAPAWTPQNQYLPPQDQYYDHSNSQSKSKDAGILGLLPDLSLPKFDKFFSDLNIKRNDVQHSLHNLASVHAFGTVVERVKNYFNAEDVGIENQDGLQLVVDQLVDNVNRQDRQGVIDSIEVVVNEGIDAAQFTIDELINRTAENPSPLIIGTTLLLSLLTGEAIGNGLTDAARAVIGQPAGEEEEEEEEEDFEDCVDYEDFYFGQFQNNTGNVDDGEDKDKDKDKDKGKSWFPFGRQKRSLRKEREARDGIVCPPHHEYYDYQYQEYVYGNYGYGNGGVGSNGGTNGENGSNGGGGSNGEGDHNGGSGSNEEGGSNGGQYVGGGGTSITLNNGIGGGGGGNGAPAVTVHVGDVSIVVGGGGGVVEIEAGGGGGGGEDNGGGGDGEGCSGEGCGGEGDGHGNGGGGNDSGEEGNNGDEEGDGEDDGDVDGSDNGGCSEKGGHGGCNEEEDRGLLNMMLNKFANTGSAVSGGIRNTLVGGLNGLRRIVKTG